MRYFVGFLITIGLIILLIIMLAGGRGEPEVPTTSKTLESYSTTDAEAIMTVDGPINSAEIHQQIRITVNRNNVTYEELTGYDGQVKQLRRFDSSTNAFSNFLSGLNQAGFTQGNTDKAMADYEGYCPLGDRYIFELQQGFEQIERFWATNCGGPKTYLGDLGTTIDLFLAQVPNYGDLTQDLDLDL